MPELRFFEPSFVSGLPEVDYKDGTRLSRQELESLRGVLVKRAKRRGNACLVRLGDSPLHPQGLWLKFSSTEEYEACLRRTFRPSAHTG